MYALIIILVLFVMIHLKFIYASKTVFMEESYMIRFFFLKIVSLTTAQRIVCELTGGTGV